MPKESGPPISVISQAKTLVNNDVTRIRRAVENEIVILDKRSSREHVLFGKVNRRVPDRVAPSHVARHIRLPGCDQRHVVYSKYC